MKSIRLLGATLLASTTLLGAGGVFADQVNPEPSQAKTPITANLTINEPEKPTPPTDSNEGGTDEGTNINGLFGIAYAPGALVGNGQLEESGETTIDLANNGANAENKHNIGVQDKTRAKDRNWSLTAQLEWTGDNQGYMDGATVTATQGNVQLNDNGNLTGPVTEGEVTIGDSATDLTISKDAPVEIMKANTGKTVNGVYNYQFKDPKLVIQNSEKVAAGTYSGNITWNLSNAM